MSETDANISNTANSGHDSTTKPSNEVEKTKNNSKNDNNTLKNSAKSGEANSKQDVKDGENAGSSSYGGSASSSGIRAKLANFALNQTNNAAVRAARAAYNIAQNVRRFAHAAQAVIHNVTQFVIQLFNVPQVFVLVAVVAIVYQTINVMSILQTYFPIDVDCQQVLSEVYEGTGKKQDIKDDVNWNDDAKTVAKALMKAGFSKVQAASILANFMNESGVSPDARNKDSGAYGLGQWLGGRLQNLQGRPNWTSVETQAQFAIDEALAGSTWSGHGNDAKTFASTTDTDAATAAWYNGFERPGSSDTTLGTRQARAKKYYKLLDEVGDKWSKDGDSPKEFGKMKLENAAGNTSSMKAESCNLNGEGGGSAKYGTIGNIPKEGKGNFSFMCKSLGVCHDGQYGPVDGRYGYQCVWYAWSRATMVYGQTGWSIVQGNGGDIAANARAAGGSWQVDDTPHPGDLISGYASGFAGDSSYGHVAFVEKVEQDSSGWKITISEGNADGSASFNSFQVRTIRKGDLHGNYMFVRNRNWTKKG